MDKFDELKSIKTREEFIDYVKLSKNIRKINRLNIKKIECGNTVESAQLFNLYYKWLVLECPYKLMYLGKTASGGIHVRTLIQWGYDWRPRKSGVEFIYLGKEGSLRVIFSQKPDGINGRTCYAKFKEVCEDFKIDLKKYAISNGEEVKKLIETTKIDFFGQSGKTYYGVHHLDLNSSYMSGIAYNTPELYPVIKEIYDKRKEDPIYKDILTHTFGYFQSQGCTVNNLPYAYANLSKQAIEFNNRYIENLSQKLKESGHYVLAYNTDGIWYSGDVYHDENEGKDLGQWKNDHINCKIRFKSKGAYEYEENSKYHPVVRGRTKLDKIKPRDQWVWGDIYADDCEFVYTFLWDEAVGIIIKKVSTFN